MVDKFLVKFFSSLNKNNIDYVVLRNYKYLPKSLNGSDLDILIKKNNLIKFYELLKKVLCESNGRIIIQYGELTRRICIAGFSKSSIFGLQIDVHEGILPYQTNSMFPIEFIFSRKKNHNGVFVVNEDDANLLAFLKEILNNSKCKKKYFIDAKKSWNKNKLIYIEPIKEIYGDSFLEKLDSILSYDYESVEIYRLAKLGQSILKNCIHIQINNVKSKIARLFRFFNPPGFTIAVLGTDGAGKTTLIKAISPALNEAVHNALYYEHMRPNLIPNIAQLFGKKQLKEQVTNPHVFKPSGVLGSLLRLFYYSCDYIFGYWLKVYPIIVKKSSIWIFDRYFYDFIIDPIRSRMSLPKRIIELFQFIIPEPDLIICLGTDPKTIHARKPELPLNEIKRQVQELKVFCRKKSKKAIWIDTGLPIEESINQALSAIIERMAARYD